MNNYRRVCIFISFILFCLALAMQSTSIATEYWIESDPILQESQRSTQLDDESSNVHSGLFSGTRRLNWGLGPRFDRFIVFDEIQSGVGFMSKSYWIGTVLFAALAILWTTVGAIFSLINTVIKPADTITGPLGIYIWSGLAFGCSALASVIYAIQFASAIRFSVLLAEHEHGGFSSDGKTRLSFSFWLMSIASLILLIPILLLCTSGIKCKRTNKYDVDEKPAVNDKGLFMY